MKIFTNEIINEIEEKYNKGYRVNRSEKIWFQNIVGIRKSGIKYLYSDEELIEYAKCYNELEYFIENFAKIKLEKGDVGNINLIDYQKECLDFVKNNRFTILLKSRQVGLSIILALYFLHLALFNKDKTILIVPFKVLSGKELLEKIKNIYKLLPFYLKNGVIYWNDKFIEFENRSRIFYASQYQDLFFGDNIDIISLNDFSHFYKQEEIFNSIDFLIKRNNNCKLIIDSGANGLNFFYKLVQNSELPEGHPNKNLFKTRRIYWYEVPGRDDNWRKEQIKMIGNEKLFNQEFDLQFFETI